KRDWSSDVCSSDLDVSDELCVLLTMTKEHTEAMLKENKISFLFAPHVHTKLRPFMKVRTTLGLPTIFNLIGPLTNPVNLDSQLLGVYQLDKLVVIAEALKKLGRKRAVVLNGAEYMDEASLAGDNHLVLLEDGHITSFTLHPEELGLPVYNSDAIRGGNPKENAAILKSVLSNEQGPYLDTVLLNAAIGLFANGKADDIKQGVDIERESIASGAAMERLNNLAQYSKNIKREAIKMTTILDKIIKEKQKEVVKHKKQPFNYTNSPYTGPNFAELVQKNKNMSMIAEIKRASPSKGLINGDVDP